MPRGRKRTMMHLILTLLLLGVIRPTISAQSQAADSILGCAIDEDQARHSQNPAVSCWSSALSNHNTTKIPPTSSLDFYCDSLLNGDPVHFILSRAQNTQVLQHLIISNCPINYLDGEDFIQLPQLQTLKFISCGINDIGSRAFQGLPNLTSVDLTGNSFSEIPSALTCNGENQSCRALNNLEELVLENNDFRKLPSDAFTHLTKVRKLNLAKNKLQSLQGDLFWSLRSLQELDLRANQIATLQPELFQNSSTLEILYLGSNSIQEIKPGTFTSLTSLKSLDLSFNQFTSLPEETFRGLECLEDLKLTNNAFKGSLPSNLFQGLISLQSIDMSDTKFSLSSLVIPEGLFHNLPHLSNVNLQNANISSFKHLTFTGSMSLTNLDFSHNHIEDFPTRFLDVIKAPTLAVVNLSHNGIFDLLSGSFQNSASLREINLAHNNLKTITNYAFYSLSALQSLDLSYNKINLIDSMGLYKLPSLIELRLNNNLLTNFQVFIFARKGALAAPLGALPQYVPVDSQISVYMEGNPLVCDCHMFSTLYNESGHSRFEDYTWPGRSDLINQRFVPDSDALVCSDPPRVRGQSIKRLKKHFFWCEMPDLCPPDCTCNAIAIELRLVANCSHRGLSEIPTDLWWGTHYLILDHNNITRISRNHLKNMTYMMELYLDNNEILQIDDGTFEDLTSLLHLGLSHNKLQTLNASWLGQLGSVETLRLEHNNISQIDVHSFQNLSKINTLALDHNSLQYFEPGVLNNTKSLTHLSLDGNPFICDCKLWWLDFKEWLLRPQVHKLFDQRYDITCTVPDHESNSSLHAEERPILQLTEDELLCNNTSNIGIRLTDTESKIIACVLGFTVLILLVVAIIFKCRNVLKVIVYNRTGWRFFHGENFEENKLYDAFLSFSSEDLRWVKNSLLKRLEEHDPPFKVCIHHRDFLVGACIAENIVEAIEKSRRTILVLSNNFLESEWCAYEFKQAHRQVLIDKSSRLIVLLMEDVAMAKLDTDLKMYLQTNTYLEKDDPLFWQKLYYAMPDNKENRQNFRNNRAEPDNELLLIENI